MVVWLHCEGPTPTCCSEKGRNRKTKRRGFHFQCVCWVRLYMYEWLIENKKKMKKQWMEWEWEWVVQFKVTVRRWLTVWCVGIWWGTEPPTGFVCVWLCVLCVKKESSSSPLQVFVLGWEGNGKDREINKKKEREMETKNGTFSLVVWTSGPPKSKSRGRQGNESRVKCYFWKECGSFSFPMNTHFWKTSLFYCPAPRHKKYSLRL